jgi:hypothetical protein
MLNDEFSMLNINDIEKLIINKLLNIAKEYNVTVEKSSASIMFSKLIKRIYQKYNKRVVILIDDWDKPLRDNLISENAKDINKLLWGIYINTKADGEYIKSVFATGEIPIRSSMLEGFNNFIDISLYERYGNICGFTKKELKQFNIENSTFNIMNKWYDGYNFLKDNVYNPFDILLFIKNNFVFDNYWFSTATPTFLIKLIEKNNYFLPRLSNVKVGKNLLDSFDIDSIDLEVILYQSGYLTIDKVEIDEDDDIIYHLKLPNQEVKKSLNNFIINILYQDKSNINKSISKALRSQNLQDLEKSLKSMYSSIPYNNFTNNNIAHYEGFYASVIYAYLQSLGLDIVGEDVTNKGRIDLTISINNLIYILEFKVGGDDALSQIKDKKYHEKYLNENKEIYLIGINFDEEDKNISKFEWERV